jgi:hypothetical protein
MYFIKFLEKNLFPFFTIPTAWKYGSSPGNNGEPDGKIMMSPAFGL